MPFGMGLIYRLVTKMDSKTIQKFLNNHDYDIRKTHNGRWIDQKCTMDVV